ncbi:MAG: desulfoferrodoxin [Candidatus Terrybacteria bacterium CG10_big_fil_rev_8_21_14_0_10_41_10]|uniref:Desulfoferrodoxin n=1 Tax=Candidatus Terrybacteria bacterium CG10_big_fil_rev_8_21_14_0_10_41_10 TaxID=1975026 RepID=A0A2M8L9W2_9BACT|nr:MAG: desulfoferrodoxin [Candidatus Terrybacteria bacterium CG10_big_fil_rev_8_21_14_0_10_41_10]
MKVTSLNQIYKCSLCGNMFEVIHVGGGEPFCCGQIMDIIEPKTEDVGAEKHVPVIEKTAVGFRVKVGSAPHPMEADHWIQWIELIADGVSYRKFLNPGNAPEAEFCVEAENVLAREYCNLHGLWRNK